MLSWTPSLEIGIAEIDAQHRALFEHAARFADAVRAGEPHGRLEELFRFLSRYAADHFQAEERYMRSIGYPGLEDQQEEHEKFTRRLLSIVPQWDSEGASQALLMVVLGFLDNWLNDHITRTDTKIAKFARR